MPFSVVTATPAAIELGASPFPSAWVLEGDPRACAQVIARSRDGAMTTVVWSCTKGRFRWQYSVDEMVHLLAGEVFITDESGVERRLAVGDTAFFPAGSAAVWRVTQDVRKVAVCRLPVPSAIGFGLRAWGWLGRSLKTMFGLGPEGASADGLLGPAAGEVATPPV